MPSVAMWAHLRMPSSTPLTIELRSQRRPPSTSRGLFGKRCTNSMEGRPSVQRSKETRQLSAPRSTAIEALLSCGLSGLPRELFIAYSSSSSQEGLGQSSVDGNDVACGARCVRAREEEDGLCAVSGVDGLSGERTSGIKLRQLVAEVVVGGLLIVDEVVLLQAGDDTVAREHGGALDDGRGADSVDANLRRVGDGEFADEMAESGLRDVVCLRTAFCDDRVCGAGEDDAAVDSLGGEDWVRLVGEHVVGSDVDFEGQAPHRVVDDSIRSE